MSINQEDLKNFKEIKADLGEVTESAPNLIEQQLDDNSLEEEEEKDTDEVKEPVIEKDEKEFGYTDSDDSDGPPMRQDSGSSALTLDNDDPEKILMSKLKGKLEDARPTGAQVHKAIKYFDLAVKIEITMYEFQSTLSNVSMLEISAFIFGIVFFLRLMARMKNIWLFIPHLIRGILGFTICGKMPKSHEIVKKLEMDKLSENSNLSFEDIH